MNSSGTDQSSETVASFVRGLPKTLDGLVLCICSFSALLWVALALLFPELQVTGRSTIKLLILALFTPVILFFLLIRMRQLPWSRTKFGLALRVFLLIAMSVLINF
ncbi:MAG: hypothetical protein ACREBU_08985 [Nitrososphaera sp.]